MGLEITGHINHEHPTDSRRLGGAGCNEGKRSAVKQALNIITAKD